MIGIVNYGMGNLGSIKHKLDRINVSSIVSSVPADLDKCDKLILPGVGHFSRAVKEIKTRDLWKFLDEQVAQKNKPILGICLGMQLMAKHSEEGNESGFGWFDAETVKFQISDKLKYKIPHIGWNQVTLKNENPLFKEIDLNSGFYFVHSYHVCCNNSEDILSETIYEYPFTSAIQKRNITGVQYHPEKSHTAGEQFLRNFVNY